jgi:hypothetical protein
MSGIGRVRRIAPTRRAHRTFAVFRTSFDSSAAGEVPSTWHSNARESWPEELRMTVKTWENATLPLGTKGAADRCRGPMYSCIRP